MPRERRCDDHWTGVAVRHLDRRRRPRALQRPPPRRPCQSDGLGYTTCSIMLLRRRGGAWRRQGGSEGQVTK
eukprot:5176959-Pleurochrysis_carterae.AAC.2